MTSRLVFFFVAGATISPKIGDALLRVHGKSQKTILNAVLGIKLLGALRPHGMY